MEWSGHPRRCRRNIPSPSKDRNCAHGHLPATSCFSSCMSGNWCHCHMEPGLQASHCGMIKGFNRGAPRHGHRAQHPAPFTRAAFSSLRVGCTHSTLESLPFTPSFDVSRKGASGSAPPYQSVWMFLNRSRARRSEWLFEKESLAQSSNLGASRYSPSASWIMTCVRKTPYLAGFIFPRSWSNRLTLRSKQWCVTSHGRTNQDLWEMVKFGEIQKAYL